MVVKRIPITAAKTFPALTGAVDVLTSGVVRHEATGQGTFGTFTGTATVNKRIPIPTSATLPEFNTALTLQQRIFRSELQASPAFPAFTVAATVHKRIALTANQTNPAITATATVNQRTPARLLLEADRTFPASAASAQLGQRSPLDVGQTYPAFASTATVLQRTATRQELQSSVTFPAFGPPRRTLERKHRWKAQPRSPLLRPLPPFKRTPVPVTY